MTQPIPLQEGGTYPIDTLVSSDSSLEAMTALRHAAVRLGPQLRKDLGLRQDAFVIEETTAGLVLRTRGVAGTITLGDVTFDIRPKHVPDSTETSWQHSLSVMLDRAHRRPVSFSRHRSLALRPRTFIDQLAIGLALELESATRHAEVRAYASQRAELSQVRGRLLISEQLRSSLLKPHKVVCEIDELSPDNPVNQLLHWAAHQLGALATQPRVRQELSVQAAKLPAMTLPIRPPSRLSFHLPRQYQHYTGAVTLATALARGLTTVPGSGAITGAGFVVGTERLFEAFVERSLARVLTGTEWELEAQKRSEYAVPCDPSTGDRSFFSTPDNVVRRSDGALVIIDAKYKRFQDGTDESAPDRPSNSDIYQMAAACVAHGCSRALLLYPQSIVLGPTTNEQKIRWWSIQIGAERVLVGAATLPLHLLASGDGIAAFDEHLLKLVESALPPGSASTRLDVAS